MNTVPFGLSSSKKLSTGHPDLRRLALEINSIIEITIIECHRNEKKQNKAFEDGFSKKRWPNSKHNLLPSEAMDIAIWHKKAPHIHWKRCPEYDMEWAYLAGIVKVCAEKLRIKVRLGQDWNGDSIFNEKFFDGPHIELVD